MSATRKILAKTIDIDEPKVIKTQNESRKDQKLACKRRFGSTGYLLRYFDLAMLRCSNLHQLFNIFLVGLFQIVRSSTMMRNVKTNFLLKRINTVHPGHVQYVEKWDHGHTDPANNKQNKNDLACK